MCLPHQSPSAAPIQLAVAVGLFPQLVTYHPRLERPTAMPQFQKCPMHAQVKAESSAAARVRTEMQAKTDWQQAQISEARAQEAATAAALARVRLMLSAEFEGWCMLDCGGSTCRWQWPAMRQPQAADLPAFRSLAHEAMFWQRHEKAQCQR